MYSQALRVALALALFKSGPQEMPFSWSLTRLAAAAAVLSSVVLMGGVVPLPLAFATGIGGVAGVAFFTRQLLRSRRLENRLAQTLAAQLLVGSLFALAMWPAIVAMTPVMQQMMETMRAGSAAGGGVDWSQVQSSRAGGPQVPVWAALWSDVLFVWSLVASARINRLAADIGRLSSWVLTLMSLFVLLGFVLLAQLFAALLFGVR